MEDKRDTVSKLGGKVQSLGLSLWYDAVLIRAASIKVINHRIQTYAYIQNGFIDDLLLSMQHIFSTTRKSENSRAVKQSAYQKCNT